MANYSGSFSGSFQGTISGSLLGSGIVSGSTQIDFNSIVNKPTTIQPFQANSIVSNNRFREVTFPPISSSVSSRLTSVEASVDAFVSGSVSSGTISGSTQIAALGYLTSASAAAAGFGSGGGASIPAGTISSSAQVVSSLPVGTISSSAQILPILTSSITNFPTEVSRSAAAAGFGVGGGETYTAGLGITITSNVITLNTSSTHFIQGVSASAAASGFGGGGGSNVAPIINNQTMSAVPESSSAGYSVGLITATDTEGNTITFGAFTISNVYLSSNPSVNLTSSLGGTSLYDPTLNPFQVNSSGLITRKNSVFLNSDVADNYVYLATVTDPFATATGSGFVYIPISAHSATTIGGNNSTYYVTESAVAGNNLTQNSNGRTVSDVTFTSTGVSQMWEVNSVPSGFIRFTNGTAIYTGSTSLALEVDSNISGSAKSGSNTIAIQITASQTDFETTKQYRDHTLYIVNNAGPTGSFSDTSANLNTNGARPGNTLSTLTWTDVESDTLDHGTFNFQVANGASITANRSGNNYLITASANLTAATYSFTASIKDVHGFATGTKAHSFVIAQAPLGTLTTNGTFYVIETAVSGNLIYTSTNGRSGTQGDLGVTYSPQYNSAAVASFTSSDARVSINAAGNLSVTGVGISGSAGGSFPGTITPTVTWRDQYNNVGSSSITINIAVNNAPTVSLDNPDTDNQNTNLATTGTRLTRLTWTDAESDALSVQTFTLTGAGAASLSSSYDGSNIFGIYAASNLAAGTYGYTASIKDTHQIRTGSYLDTITISQATGGSITAENFYIIESALSGAVVTNDADGSGSQANVNILYSPSYGTQAAQGFNSSDSVIAISSVGNLSVKTDVSGAYTNGNTITPTIFWVDQYGNPGTGSITISVTDNQNPTASFTNATLTAPVTTNTTLVTVSLTDPEGATPFSMSLSGLSATSMSSVPQNVASSSYLLKNTVDINDGVTLSYTASVFDPWNNQVDYRRTLTIAAPVAASPTVYIYYHTAGTSTTTEAQMISALGDPGADGIALTSGSILAYLVTGTIGISSYTTPAGLGSRVLTLVTSQSMDSLRAISGSYVNTSGVSGGGALLVIFPSSSLLGDKPTTMYDGVPPDGTPTNGEYYVYGKDAAIPGTIAAGVYYFTTDVAVNGTDRWGFVFGEGRNTNNSRYFLMPDSASAP